MDAKTENREKPRFLHESRLLVENHTMTGVQRNARMFNFCEFGLYFEADMQLDRETQISIGIHNSPYAPEPDIFEWYYGIIQWCEELEDSSYYYGYGVKLVKIDTDNDSQNQNPGERAHPRKSCAIPLEFKLDERTYEGTLQNVSSAGAAVGSQTPVMAGKRIILKIPLKRKKKTAVLKGTIAWSDQRGFGVKFLKAK